MPARCPSETSESARRVGSWRGGPGRCRLWRALVRDGARRSHPGSGFHFWGGWGDIYRGWIKANGGNVTEGISLLRSGLAAYRATAAELWMPYFTALLARACGIADQTEEAVTLLDDASQIAERTGERWFAAELNREKGRLLLRQGNPE